MLIAQLAIAVIVLGANLLPSLGNLISPSNAPDLTQPASPGDQTRRYTPRDLPARTPNPGSRPIPANTDMPDRLAFEFTTWEGARPDPNGPNRRRGRRPFCQRAGQP